MEHVRWGIIGCGDVTEVKSGPGFQKADGSSLVAVTRRDRTKAEDYARRHGVPRVHATAADLIRDPAVDAVYVATPPDTHEALALLAADAGKPCLVEKPMARNHAGCLRMIDAFRTAGIPLWVAYYRRALPRFLEVRRLLSGRPSGGSRPCTSRSPTGSQAARWRRTGGSIRHRRAGVCSSISPPTVLTWWTSSSPRSRSERLCPQHGRGLCRGRCDVRGFPRRRSVAGTGSGTSTPTRRPT